MSAEERQALQRSADRLRSALAHVSGAITERQDSGGGGGPTHDKAPPVPDACRLPYELDAANPYGLDAASESQASSANLFTSASLSTGALRAHRAEPILNVGDLRFPDNAQESQQALRPRLKVPGLPSLAAVFRLIALRSARDVLQ